MFIAKRHRHNNQSGQAMMIMVATMTLFATGIAMFGLEYTRVARKESVEFKRTTDVISTLNATARYLQQIYYSEANCDPYVFNIRLNSMSNRAYQSPFRQQHLVDSGAGTQSFGVSIGRMNPMPPSIQTYAPPVGNGAGAIVPPYQADGYGPQDVTVTFWVTPYGQLGEHGVTKYEQTVTLLNTCSPTANTTVNAGPGFGNITNATTFSNSVQTQVAGSFAATGYCAGNRPRGTLDVSTGTLNSDDRILMMNYVRSGVTTGGTSGTVDTTCADLNRDGLFNEIDLNIMDKTLKGYMYFHVPSYQQ